MKRAPWIVGLSLAALAGVVLTGILGIVSSANLIMAPPDATAAGSVPAQPAPAHDPSKPTVAVVLGDTRTEATDFLGPYAMFAESQAYNVYAVADSRVPRTLAGGIDVVPQLTFAELAARVPSGPDVIVVPAIEDIYSPKNASVVDWLRRHRDGATLFAWCVGAEVLAASGLIDGRPVTTHWGEIDRLEQAYPAPGWRRGVRYVDDGDLLTTGGITAGVDATLHFLASRTSRAVASRVAEAIHYPESPFVDDPRAAQYTTEPVDAAVFLNLAFNWPKPEAAVWLYDGVGEIDLAAVVEAFGVTSTYATTTFAAEPTVTSEHGLQLVPRRQPDESTSMDRVLVPGGDGAGAAASAIPSQLLGDRPPTVLEDPHAPAYAFASALEELAASNDLLIAESAARQLEVRIPLRLHGPGWPVKALVVALMAAVVGSTVPWAAVGLARRLRRRLGRATPADGRRRTASGSLVM